MKAIPLLLAALSGLTFAAGKPQQLTSPDQIPEGLAKSDWQSIRSAHEGWAHQIRAVEGGWQAVNSGQQWATTFDGRGFLATPKDADWNWGLAFQSYGFGERQTRIDGTPVVRAAGQRLTYQWSNGVEEWFVNDSRGLEHGFTLAERPAGSRENEALSLTLATRGPLKPSLAADGLTVYFRDAGGAPLLNYSGLKVWDADGTVLPSRFQVEGSEVRLLVEESTARYPLTIDPIAQQAYLKAGNNGGDTSDQFGRSVAVSGNTVVVGAFQEDSSTTGVNSTPDDSATDSGAVYVFVRSGTSWSQQAYLKASNTGVNDRFGISVSVSGETVVVGAYLESSSTTGGNSTPNEGAGGSGAAYVFTRSGTTWSQQAYLKASNTGASDSFGYSVAVSGDTLVVGAYLESSSTTGVNSTPNESAIYSGAAYVFTRNGTTWSQQAYLKASNTGVQNQFGTSVAVSGDTVVVGATFEESSTTGVNSTPNESAIQSGAAYVFTRSGTTWSEQAYLKASNTGASDYFGRSVAVSGDTVVVGAYGENSNTTGVNSIPNESAGDSGAAYVFVRSGSAWSQQAFLKASNSQAGDNFGTAVSVSGDTVVIGADQEDSSTTGVNSAPNDSADRSGAAYVFTRSGLTWSQQAYLKASNTGAFDRFGNSVAVSGDTIVVGAGAEDSSTTGVNSPSNENASSAGAAYVYSRVGTTWSQQAYLKASNTPAGPGREDRFGSSVSVSGNTVVVGALLEDSNTTGVNSAPNEGASWSGAAYVFVRAGTTWSQQAYLKASNTGQDDYFGTAVAVSGDTIVVGAGAEDSSTTGVNSTPNESVFDSGAAYIFTRSGTTWSQQAYLKAGNSGSGDQFGYSVGVAGNTVVVGAYRESSSTTGVNSTPNEGAGASGAAYIFTRSGTTWSQQAYLKASNTEANDYFGIAVAASGDTVVVGAYGEDSSTMGVNSAPNESAGDSGAAYVFTRSGTTWSQQAYLKASNTGTSDYFGTSVAVSGDTVVVGAISESSSTTGVNSTPDESANGSGAAYVFTHNGTTWSQQAFLKAGNSQTGDNFGTAVSVSGDTVVVGAHQEDSSTTGVNSTPDESAINSGAAYVFTRSGTTWIQQAYLKASNTGASDLFGTSVAVSGDTVVVGAIFEDSGTTGVNSTPNESASASGAAYIFTGLGPVIETPEIVIKLAGTDIATNTTQAYGPLVVGTSSDLVFTILNTGSGDLTLIGTPLVAVAGSPDFTVPAQPASPIAGPSGSTTFTVRFAPSSIGSKNAVLSIPNNDADENPFTINLSGSGVTAETAFNNAVSANSSLTGLNALPTAIPFGDGVENLLKYAFNMNPAGPDVSVLATGGNSGLPQIAVDSSGAELVLKVAFLRRKGSGLIYTPQRSGTLGTFVAMTGTQTVTSIDAQWERVTVLESAPPASTTSSFARVEVRLP